MSAKHALLKGTFILTAAGLATRFMGFFYRIFLSHTFGEEGVGLYQLIFPVYALGFSLTSAGIEIALSRCVARRLASGQKSLTRSLLYTSLILTVTCSCIVTIFLQKNALFIADVFLKDRRCADFLIILSYAFPFAAVHSCICGYYLGKKETRVPAFSQLLEQTARILSVLLLYQMFRGQNSSAGISVAVAGLIIGEIASSAYCLYKIRGRSILRPVPRLPVSRFLSHAKELLTLSAPLTATRVSLNILQSIEAVSIPLCLQAYGLARSEALRVYGVLNGMALPCILFPCALTSSISAMLLPTVAEIQAQKNKKQLLSVIEKCVLFCIFLGCLSCIFLLLFGNRAGTFLFDSTMAGTFITVLSWMCPFLYTNTTLISIINGVGKTHLSFLFNFSGLLIRIASVLFLIPLSGIYGYLFGLLSSQVFLFLSALAYIAWYIRKH